MADAILSCRNKIQIQLLTKEAGMTFFKSATVAVLATIVFLPSSGQATQYQLGKPFPMACEGNLVYHKGIYSLEQDIDNPSSDPDHDLICGLADLAEETDTGSALKYTLKEKAIIQILRSCSLGKLCRVVGYVNGLSHDVYFWVRIDSMSAK
jgi:hypothetical protein